METLKPPPKERGELLYRLVVAALDLALRALFSLQIVGAERLPERGAALLVANHVSYLDPCVLAAVAHRRRRRIRFLALADLFDKPILGWVLARGRMIPVERGRGSREAIRAALRALDEGEITLIYPEGTIARPQEMLPAQRGAGMLALATGAPVIPVGTWGLERRRRGPFLRRPAAIAFGEPVDTSAPEGAGRQTQERTAETLLAAVRTQAGRAELAGRRR